jgi:hypothetical protein
MVSSAHYYGFEIVRTTLAVYFRVEQLPSFDLQNKQSEFAANTRKEWL